MKLIIVLLVVCIMPLGQTNRHFKYTFKRDNYYTTPSFESNPFQKNEKVVQCLFVLNDPVDGNEYLRKLINNVTSNILKNQIAGLQYRAYEDHSKLSRSKMNLYVNDKGQIKYVSFTIFKNDKEILSDEMLFQIYKEIKTVSIDLSKGKLETVDGENTSLEKYFVLTLPLYSDIFKGKKL